MADNAYLAHEKYDPPVPPRPENMTSSSAAHGQLSVSLLRFINREKPLEETKEVEHRQAVLKKLRQMIVQWIKDVWIGIGYPAGQAADLGGTLETSGSFRLGVNDPGGDIDTICIVPQHVSHADFFGQAGCQGPEGGFVGILENTEGVEGIKPIPGAKVPLIKIDSFQNVEIDLLFAQLPLDRVPRDIDEEIDDESILNNVKVASLRALSGPRDNIRFDKLLEHVNADLREFQLFLRLVRHWAKSRGLWGNKYGYFGGVNCAILCIKVIQHFPKKKASSLLRLFFKIFAEYPWGPRRPVFISKVGMLDSDGQPKYPDLDPDLGFYQYPWQMPRGIRRDGYMPIVTPCYPVIDSMSKATRMSVRLFKREFARGRDILTKYMPSAKGVKTDFDAEDTSASPADASNKSNASSDSTTSEGTDAAASTPAAESQSDPKANIDPFDDVAERLGKELFAPMCFPAEYKYYIQINASSKDSASHKLWVGLVSAQLRGLIEQLSNTPALRRPISMFHLWCKEFELIIDGVDQNTASADVSSGDSSEPATEQPPLPQGAPPLPGGAPPLPSGAPPLPNTAPPLPYSSVLQPPLPGQNAAATHDSQGNLLAGEAPPPPKYQCAFLIGFHINHKFAPRPAEVRRAMVKRVKEWKEYIEMAEYVQEYLEADCEVNYNILPRKGLPKVVLDAFGGEENVLKEAKLVEERNAAEAAEAERLANEAAEGGEGEDDEDEEYYDDDDGDGGEDKDVQDAEKLEAASARKALSRSALRMSEVLQSQLAEAPDFALPPSNMENSASFGRWTKRKLDGERNLPLAKLSRQAIHVEL